MKIVLATFGSLGDMHPLNALGLELKKRGHEIIFAAMDAYREKIELLGFEFRSLRPHFDPEDKQLARLVMDEKKGSEVLLKEIILPNLRPQYEDLCRAVSDADLLISGEVIFVADSVEKKTGVKWITTTLAPGTLLSAFDPFVPPTAQWLKHLRFFGSHFHRAIFDIAKKMIDPWFAPYREFRREIGLSEDHDPLFGGKSGSLNLALFSKVLGTPQPDWHQPTVQCGFCFYDGQNDLGAMPAELEEFLANSSTPIVFTLGSAAVMDAGDFFEESAKAAQILNRRAVLLYGTFNEPPKIMQNSKFKIQNASKKNSAGSSATSVMPEGFVSADGSVAAFNYAPFSRLFPKAAAVVHQGGVGTTAQVLRAGVPQLIMPYSHDQPDNAARCERLGVAKIISRDAYTAEKAARRLHKLLSDSSYMLKAENAAQIVRAENGTKTACDAIEKVLGLAKSG